MDSGLGVISMRNSKTTKLFTLPIIIFVLLFVIIPVIYVAVLSFLKKDLLFGVSSEFTLDNYKIILDPIYLNTFISSLKMALTSTIIVVLIGYPFGYFLAKQNKKTSKIVLTLLIVPFWTNSLVKLYGWMVILRSNGVLNSILDLAGVIDSPLKMLYTYEAVLLGMLYSLLPFMILPVYSSAEKIDWSLLEAARDLGASSNYAFWTVAFKLTLPGLLSGFVLTFVPSISLFFIADLLGGGKIMLVGNLIKNQLLQSRNWPFGAALSIILMLLTISTILVYKKLTKSDLEGLV